jgi:hypothetical protein
MNNSSTPESFRKLAEQLRTIKVPSKFIFILVGILSTAWFLIRVIPKPQRATYPCMKAAAPWASAFVIYILGITGSTFFLRRTWQAIIRGRYKWALTFILLIFFFGFLTLFNFPNIAKATSAKILSANEIVFPSTPIGTPKGKNPGRVVWVHNEHATNENLTNTEGDYWHMDLNANEDTIKKMLDQAVMHLTDGANIMEAWDELFKHYNEQKGKGTVGYTPGETIVIKINLTNSCCGMWDTEKIEDIERMDQTPQLVNALLATLIDDLGINESDIWCGDNYRMFRNVYWDKCHSNYPDVVYMDNRGINNRVKSEASAANVLVFSDGLYTSTLPQHYIDADYFINASCLKSHNLSGITLGAKNHQGSVIPPGGSVENQSAEFMHYCLPVEDPGYGKYRHLVDYMAHEYTGGKTLLYLVDGIWGGDNWAGNIFKWEMEPFNNDYPNSLFVSQDPVAIEAVCFDFLLEEYKDKIIPEEERYPYFDGVNDYLLQAADESYWPDNFIYDPEGDGSKITSQGVYEHWNNGIDKEYSGQGIDFVKIPYDLSVPGEQSSSEAKLSDLLMDGSTINTFYPDTLNYSIGLPEGTSVIPVIEATAIDSTDGITIIPATEIPGITNIVVTSATDPNVTLTYTIEFFFLYCRTDTDNSGSTDVDDLKEVLKYYGTSCSENCPADIDKNGFIDVDDLKEVIKYYGTSCI